MAEAEERPVDLPEDLDQDKLAETSLALLSLTLNDQDRAWKALDWSLTNLLFRKGWIHDPASKAKSVVLTDEGIRLAEEFLRKHFARPRTG